MNSITIICEHSSKNTLSNLTRIVNYAKNLNLKFIRPEELSDFFNDKLGGNYILLTFDDGQEYKFDGIADFLRQNKIKAISFVVPLHWGFHSTYTNFDYYIRNKDVFEVGCHSLTHTMVANSLLYDGIDITSPKLIYYGDKNLKVSYNYGLICKEFNKIKNRLETEEEYNIRLDRELNFSKEWIERATGKQCRYFAYPYGVYNNYVLEKIKKYGYEMAFTVNRTEGTIFSVPRIDTMNLDNKTKNNVIDNVIVKSWERLSQNDIDVKYGIYK